MKVFYHDDNDGKCSASLIYLYAKNNNLTISEKDFYEINYYNKLIDTTIIKNNEIVYILDYSFTKNTLNKLMDIWNKTKYIYWYDHHKSSFEIINEAKDICTKCIIDTNISASKIIYNNIIKDTNIDSKYIKEFVDMVDDCDTGTNEISNSLFFNLGISIYNNPCCELWYMDTSKIINNGKVINDYINIINTRILNDYKYFIEINNKKCIVLNSNIKSYKIFKELYDEYKFAIRWSFNGYIYEYSIYSEFDDIDCSAIAKHFDPTGGGHKRASGFRSTELIFKNNDTFTI